MPKPKKKGKKHAAEVEIVPPEPPEPKPLKEESVYFWTDIPERLSNTVPPPTPAGLSDVLILPFPIPETFPSLDDFEVPYVREAGIKTCIEIFGEFLGCTNYTFDYIQFWLLDVITDCLWRAQDEYSFTKPEQKLVLEWILYMFRVMRDPTIFFSRKQFFKLFKEAILMAGQLIQEGHKVIPRPDDMFELIFPNEVDNEEISPEEPMDSPSEHSSSEDSSSDTDTSESESTFTISKSTSEHVVLMNVGDKERRYILKRRVCSCEQGSTPSFGTTFTSDMTKTTESVEDIEEESVAEEEIGLQEQSAEYYMEPVKYKDYKMFYNPDTKTPARFMPLLSEGDKGILKKMNDDDRRRSSRQLEILEKPCQIIGDILLLDSASKTSSATNSMASVEPTTYTPKASTIYEPTTLLKDTETSDKTVDDKIRSWREYLHHKQDLNDMNDSKVGVAPPGYGRADICGEHKKEKPKVIRNSLKETTEKMLRQILANINPEDASDEPCGLDIEYKTKNLSILCAIIDLVFDYFYQNFHFTLLKLALKTNPGILVQNVNTEWSVPKQNLMELVKPKPAPKKKEKHPKKDKKSKKGKDKKSKSSKDKKSKDKKGKKGDKKSKKSEKKQKPKKLTKEELKRLKEEQEKQRLLQEQLEAEKRKEEENRRCMFPLTDAANDELYMGLFENWEKPKEPKEKGGKKGKGDKKKKKKK